MECAKCGAAMERLRYEGVEVDRCTRCHGLWFDSVELEQLLEMRGSEVIDDGDAEVGERYNTVDRVDCPRGHGRMVRLVDHEQTHVWYEQCGACGGTFLDAGEFRDLKHDTLMDFFRDIFTRERR